MSKFWSRRLVLGLLFGACRFAAAQTQLNLSTQSKSANFSNEGPTKPMQTGTTLPAVCSIGQMFFLTTATPGSNLYACTATNVWTGIIGSGGGSGSGGTLTAGTGIVITQTGSASTLSLDTALIPTKAVVQATTSNIVTLTSTSSSGLTGTGNPTLGAYSDKQLIEFTWNVACAGGAMNLAVDGLSAVNLVKADGATALSTSDCPSGQTNLFSYDGTLGVFKLLGGGAAATGGGTTIAAAPPYLTVGATNYLMPGMFAVSLPPASGWSTVNFTGATLNTTGQNGALSIDSALTTGTSLKLETRAIGSTSTLIAAVGFTPFTGGGSAYCGIGIYGSGSTNVYSNAINSASSSMWVNATHFNSPTSKDFDAGQVTTGGSLTYLKLTYSSGTATAYVSIDGSKWLQLDQRTGYTGYDNWMFFTSGSTGGISSCMLYSWSVQ